MRNVLVHPVAGHGLPLYWDIDYRRLFQAATAQLSDFDEYAQALPDYVAEDLRDSSA